MNSAIIICVCEGRKTGREKERERERGRQGERDRMCAAVPRSPEESRWGPDWASLLERKVGKKELSLFFAIHGIRSKMHRVAVTHLRYCLPAGCSVPSRQLSHCSSIKKPVTHNTFIVVLNSNSQGSVSCQVTRLHRIVFTWLLPFVSVCTVNVNLTQCDFLL